MPSPVTLLALTLAALAGCDDGARMMLQLKGDLATAASIDVILASPEVVRRTQRTGALDASTGRAAYEDVAYVAQAAVVRIKLSELALSRAGEPLLQLAADEGARYVPIVLARDEGEVIVAIGLFDPKHVFDGDDDEATAVIENTSAGVRVYPIEFEPIALSVAPGRPDANEPQPPATVFDAVCYDKLTQAPTTQGHVWRRADGLQLRILVPTSGEPASELLAAPDLDCDQHAAGVAGRDEVDQDDALDCDDLSRLVHNGQVEACNGLDDNCDDTLDAVALGPPCAPGCAGAPAAAGVCDESGAGISGDEICVATQCVACEVNHDSAGGQTPLCPGWRSLPLTRCAAAGCEVTLIDVAAPAGWAVDLALTGPNTRYGLGEPVMIGGAFGTVSALKFYVTPASAQGQQFTAGHLTVHVRSLDPAFPPRAVTIALQAGTSSTGLCGTGGYELGCTGL